MHELAAYLSRVYRFALRLARDPHEAEEIVQETYLRACRKRSSLRDPAAGGAWLLRIAANVWRDRLRGAARRREELAEMGPDAPLAAAPSPGPAEEDEVRRVLRLMDGLPPRQRQVLYLSAVEELGHAQIAKVLDISGESVKANLSLARKTMRRRLREP